MTAPVYTTRTNSDGSVEILESRPHWIATVASPQLAEALIAALAGPAPAPQPAPEPEPLFPDDGDEGRCEQCQGECDQDGRCRYEDAEEGEAAEEDTLPEGAVPGVWIGDVWYPGEDLDPLPEQVDGFRWSDDQVAWLSAAVAADLPWEAIASVIGRSEGACRQRWMKIEADYTRDRIGVAV